MRVLAMLLGVAAVAAVAWLALRSTPPPRPDAGADDAQWLRWAASESAWGDMLAVEERIRGLEPHLQLLGNEALDLSLPGARSRALFAEHVELRDAEAPPAGPDTRALPALGVSERGPASTETRSVARGELTLWPAVFAEIRWFEHARFKLRSGAFRGDDENVFEGDVRFVGTARLASGELASLRVDQDVTWRRDPAAKGEDPWRISVWRTREIARQRAPGPFFQEVLDAALPDDDTRRHARVSEHEELVRRWLADPEGASVPPHFFAPAMDRHPGLAVADVDGDGFDDLYVLARWGRNQLLRNRGDGTFEDAAPALGLDLDGHTSSALFADFDNDGDLDVVVGRTLARSVYLEQRDGRFAPPESGTPERFPYLASSVSAADFDGDGRLDVYVSTYAARMAGSHRAGEILAPYLPAAELQELLARQGSDVQDRTRNLFGPPNVLLRNLGGGRFERWPDETAGAYRNTYQATWSDYDADGDADLYLSNDFGPNQLLRGDGRGGFEDVTEPTGTADLGFGMGAAWGDYDGDGRFDLYVSNMYSDAGRRITRGLERLDPAFRKMARGNTLFRNEGERFRVVSGLEAPALTVEKAGWSWGGQFADVDNDGHLDVLALSGYYTAPPEFAIPVDT